jgi:hypothetical protein
MPRRWRTVLNPQNLTPDRLTLKADPQQTDVQIGLAVGISDKTVASVRAELVARSEIPSVDERVDRKRRTSARKPRGNSPSGMKNAARITLDAENAPPLHRRRRARRAGAADPPERPA